MADEGFNEAEAAAFLKLKTSLVECAREQTRKLDEILRMLEQLSNGPISTGRVTGIDPIAENELSDPFAHQVLEEMPKSVDRTQSVAKDPSDFGAHKVFDETPTSVDDSEEFSLRLICPTGNIGGVIGKGGAIINQIRQETRAGVKVDSSSAEGDDCLINISSKEHFEDQLSPTIEAARRLQPRCSEKVERDSGLVSFTTRLLVPTSRIGCLIGKGGSIITEMRRVTKANIRVLSKENLPKVAADDEEMVQISGDLDVCENALLNVATRLRANLFDKEGSLLLPVVPYVPVPANAPDGMPYDDRDSRRHGRGYSSGYGGSNDFPPADPYNSYNSGLQSPGGASGYGMYGGYSSGRSGSSGMSGQTPIPRRKPYY